VIEMAKKEVEKKKWRFFWEEPLQEVEKTRRDMEENIKSFWTEPFMFEFTLQKITFPKISVFTGAIRQTDKDIVARIPLPGFTKEEINLKVTENSIHVKAEKKKHLKEKTEKQIFWSAEQSRVERAYRLPVQVVPEKVKAKLENGVLTVVLPKVKKTKEEEEKTVKIE